MRQRIFLWMMVLAVAIIFSAVTAYSGTITLPKTGQETCYNSAGGKITCDGTTGQDGDLKVGEAWPDPRFVVDDCGTSSDTSDDVVTDNLTGLMWTRDASIGSSGPADVLITWANALTIANNFNDTGADLGSGCSAYTDWRLPNVNELESLINYGVADPLGYLNNPQGLGVGTGFYDFGGANAYYWASTTYTHYAPSTGKYTATDAWALSIGKAGSYIGAYLGPYEKAGIPTKAMTDSTFLAGTLRVWPVRGGDNLGGNL